MKQMKKDTVLRLLFWSLAVILLLSLHPKAETESLYDSVIRIHVLANSDSREDQARKLLVRDGLLAYAAEHFSFADGREAAAEALTEHLDNMRDLAENLLRENGSEEKVSLSLTEEYYPTREYEALSLPAGRYLSLQVKIGKAEGQNWWCVLFPPICVNSAAAAEDALLEAGMSETNVKTVARDGAPFRFRFKILEIWEEAKESLRSFLG